MALCDN